MCVATNMQDHAVLCNRLQLFIAWPDSSSTECHCTKVRLKCACSSSRTTHANRKSLKFPPDEWEPAAYLEGPGFPVSDSQQAAVGSRTSLQASASIYLPG